MNLVLVSQFATHYELRMSLLVQGFFMRKKSVVLVGFTYKLASLGDFWVKKEGKYNVNPLFIEYYTLDLRKNCLPPPMKKVLEARESIMVDLTVHVIRSYSYYIGLGFVLNTFNYNLIQIKIMSKTFNFNSTFKYSN